MSLKKPVLVKLSTISHIALGLVLCDLTPDILRRLVLLVCIGVICGIQCICIRRTHGDESIDTIKVEETIVVDNSAPDTPV